MKIGDLVKWSEIEEIYHSTVIEACSQLASVRKRGIIIDKNLKYFFVFWENGELVCQTGSDLEVISGS